MSSKDSGGFDWHPHLRPTSSGNLGYILPQIAMDEAPRRIARDQGIVPGAGQPSPDPVGDLVALIAKIPDAEDQQRARDLLAEIGIELSPAEQTTGTGQAADSAPSFRVYARTTDAMTKRFGPVVNRLKATPW